MKTETYKFIALIKFGENDYKSIVVEGRNRLDAYNKIIEMKACGKEGKLLSISEI